MSKIRKTALANGIGVITEEMADVESATLGIWVKTGSRYEPASLGGISHFIEHLLFKGTEKRTAHDISKEIESVGGVLNAFTGREYTCFYAKVLSKDLPRAVELLSDIFMNSLFDPKEIKRERQVVLQEIKMVDDTPDDLIHDIFSETIWKGHPLAAPVLGTRKTLRTIGREEVVDYISRHYNPSRVFITAAGNIKHGPLVKRLAKTFGTISKRGVKGQTTRPRAVAATKLVKRDLEQVHLCLGAPAPSQAHADRYKLYLLDTVLGGGMSSRLFQEIREKRGLAYSVYSYLNLSADVGSLAVYVGTSHDKFKEVLSLVLDVFSSLDDVPEEELVRAKDHLKGSMILGLESSVARMMKMAKNEIYFGRPVTIKEITDGIDKVTTRDIERIAKRLLDRQNLTLAAIGRVKKSDLPRELRRA